MAHEIGATDLVGLGTLLEELDNVLRPRGFSLEGQLYHNGEYVGQISRQGDELGIRFE